MTTSRIVMPRGRVNMNVTTFASSLASSRLPNVGMWAERQVHKVFILQSLTGAWEALTRRVDTCRTPETASMPLELWSIGSTLVSSVG